MTKDRLGYVDIYTFLGRLHIDLSLEQVDTRSSLTSSDRELHANGARGDFKISGGTGGGASCLSAGRRIQGRGQGHLIRRHHGSPGEGQLKDVEYI